MSGEQYRQDGELLERLKPEDAVRLFDSIAKGPLAESISRISNKRGSGVDIMRNGIEFCLEEGDNVDRISAILKILQYPSNDSELMEEKIQELLDLIG